ncbi:hypothetical protein P3T73_01095 [Kiritimatiellota bacterium B12222]|nr:hypothetical protein P3T73_01095 [Kiritimatiellota bacterium B12222]
MKAQIIKNILLFFALYSTYCSVVYSDLLKVKMSHLIQVVDEDGKNIENAEISITFHHTSAQRQKTGSRFHTKELVISGGKSAEITSEGLKFTIINVNSEGYWNASKYYDWDEKDRIDGKTDGSPNGHYKKEFTIVLRKKENPRPMFVHKSKYHATRTFNTPMGYDFEVGDLVEPFGTGKTTDLIFTLHQDKKEGKAYSHRLEMTFPQPEDGLIIINKEPGSESKLLLGAIAPENGYIPELNYTKGVEKRGWKFWVFQRPSKEDLGNVEGYWFRTRTEQNPENGEIKARYGKINGPITFLVDELGGAFYFTYYFSPNQSRSLEWNGESLVPNANLQSVNKR